jgi:alpha-ketoglutarate-dependent taurine dioxygenase
MRVEYISSWSSHEHLVRKVQSGLQNSSLVVVKRLALTGPEYESFLTQFGAASPQSRANARKYLIMGDRPYEETGIWFDKREEWTLHVDGIMNINWKRPALPTTFIYGSEIAGLEGGETYFYDSHDLYESFGRSEEFDQVKAVYHNNTLGPDSPTMEEYVLRYSPWSGKPYLLIDEWFTQSLSVPGLLDEYRANFPRVYRFEHHWEPHDLLVWSNETFVHGRTSIRAGRRVMWRGIVWDAHKKPIRRS